MNAANSLRASADLYLRQGNETDAAFCKRMADDAGALGAIGNALYRHWASEQAQRATVKGMV